MAPGLYKDLSDSRNASNPKTDVFSFGLIPRNSVHAVGFPAHVLCRCDYAAGDEREVLLNEEDSEVIIR
jgi:hypothetical protein